MLLNGFDLNVGSFAGETKSCGAAYFGTGSYPSTNRK